MMQGGYINHCALPCMGAKERITMVTSFRPRNKIYPDVTDLRNIRDCSNPHELHDQFTQSRLNIVQEAIEVYRSRLLTRRRRIEDAFGRRGGLKQPTVDPNELENLVSIIVRRETENGKEVRNRLLTALIMPLQTGTLGNALVQMRK